MLVPFANIDTDALARQGKVSKRYRAGHQGVGSHVYPPGHPRYLAVSIYTQGGNEPSPSVPQIGIVGPDSVVRGFARLEEVDHLYVPPTFDMGSERIVAWLAYLRYIEAKERATFIYSFFPYAVISPEWTRRLMYNEGWATVPDMGKWWQLEDTRPTAENCPHHYGCRDRYRYTLCGYCGRGTAAEIEETKYKSCPLCGERDHMVSRTDCRYIVRQMKAGADAIESAGPYI